MTQRTGTIHCEHNVAVEGCAKCCPLSQTETSVPSVPHLVNALEAFAWDDDHKFAQKATVLLRAAFAAVEREALERAAKECESYVCATPDCDSMDCLAYEYAAGAIRKLSVFGDTRP